MKNFTFSFIFCAIALHCTINAQNEAQKWYFGNQAGLDFASNPPSILTNGMISTSEGCASISNALGNLLFYTDGITVYNAAHAVMANGNGLMGNSSTTQSGVIVKQPGNSNLYYVFTLDAGGGGNGFKYSIVDMNLAAGMGSVTTKNSPIYSQSSERMTGVRHCNGVDVWVVTHDMNSNVFRSNLLNSGGLTLAGVTSTLGSNISGSQFVGYMKISPNGRKLAVAIANGVGTGFEIFDFDPATGVISNSLALVAHASSYGVEFSPDGTKLYGALWAGSYFYQWDLCAGSNAAILASQNTITCVGGGALQLATNGKIYLTKGSGSWLGVINNPNAMGPSCNYVDQGQSISPKNCTYGLPNFINSFYKAPFTSTLSCNTASFTAPATQTFVATCGAAGYSITGIQWQFGEPNSGSLNTSTLSNPSHNYAGPGTYTVKLISTNLCSSDTVVQTINIINASPTLNVAGTFTICKGDKRTYTVSGANSYTWTGNVTTATIALNPTVSTAYSVIATNSINSCVSNRTFSISVNKCLGTIDETFNERINAFPNPFKNQLIVEATKNTAINIIDQNGMNIYENMMEIDGELIINTTEFAPGVYLIQLSTKDEIKRLRAVKLE